MEIKNPTVANALQSALRGGEVSPIANHAKRRTTAHNAKKRAVVLNVRPPSNPAKKRAFGAIAAIVVTACSALPIRGEDIPLHQPNGWSEAAVAPMSYLQWGDKATIVKLNGDGMIDTGSMEENWRKHMSENADSLTAFNALQSALQAKREIEVLPPLDTSALATFVKGDEIRIADITAEYSRHPDAVDNRRHCGKARDQGNVSDCAIASAVNYLRLANAWSCGKVETADYSCFSNSVARLGRDGIGTGGQVFADYLSAHPGLYLATAIPAGVKLGDESKDPGEVCALVKALIAHYGGFIASITATWEWYLLLPHYEAIWGRRGSAVRGVAPRPTGLHCVVVCGYDDDFVYVQNSWGDGWGDLGNGCGRITWKEFAREFRFAEFVTDDAAFSKMLEDFPMLDKITVRGLGNVE